MHQVASAILSFFLSPFNWIILLMIGQFFVKSARTKKTFRFSALIVFIIFSNGWLLNSYAKHWQPWPKDISKESPFSCAILLGGFGSPDMEGCGYFNSTSDRFIQAVKLYETGKIQHILISGGNGRTTKKEFN